MNVMYLRIFGKIFNDRNIPSLQNFKGKRIARKKTRGIKTIGIVKTKYSPGQLS